MIKKYENNLNNFFKIKFQFLSDKLEVENLQF